MVSFSVMARDLDGRAAPQQLPDSFRSARPVAHGVHDGRLKGLVRPQRGEVHQVADGELAVGGDGPRDLDQKALDRLVIRSASDPGCKVGPQRPDLRDQLQRPLGRGIRKRNRAKARAHSLPRIAIKSRSAAIKS